MTFVPVVEVRARADAQGASGMFRAPLPEKHPEHSKPDALKAQRSTCSEGGALAPIRNAPQSAPGELQFVNTTDYNQLRHASTLKVVRGHVMRRIRAGQRVKTSNQSTSSVVRGAVIPLSDRRLGSDCGCTDDQTCEQCRTTKDLARQYAKKLASPGLTAGDPIELFGAGLINPFDTYPTKMQPHMHELLSVWIQHVGPAQLPLRCLASDDNPLVRDLGPILLTS